MPIRRRSSKVSSGHRDVPELRFAHDDSAAEAQRISSLIDSALESDKNDEQR